MTESKDNVVTTSPVRISATLQEMLLDEQYHARKRGEKAPSFAQLLEDAWNSRGGSAGKSKARPGYTMIEVPVQWEAFFRGLVKLVEDAGDEDARKGLEMLIRGSVGGERESAAATPGRLARKHQPEPAK